MLGLSRRHAVAWRHSGHGNNPLQQNRFPSHLKQRRRNTSSESRSIPAVTGYERPGIVAAADIQSNGPGTP